MDSTMNLLPIAGSGTTHGGAAALGGAGGALVGSLLFGRGGLGWGGYGDGAAAATVSAGSNGFTTQYILDQITGVNNAIGNQTSLLTSDSNLIFKNLCDNASANAASDAMIMQSLSNNNMTTQVAASNLERSITGAIADNDLTSCQNMHQLDSSFNSALNQIQTSLMGQNAQMASCCCQTQRAIDGVNFQSVQNTCDITNAIRDDGAATRALIVSNEMQELRDKLCDAKTQIGSLQSQMFTSAALANQADTLIKHMTLLADAAAASKKTA